MRCVALDGVEGATAAEKAAMRFFKVVVPQVTVNAQTARSTSTTGETPVVPVGYANTAFVFCLSS